MELQGFNPPRPMTHDLIISLLKEFDAKVVRVIINDIKDNTFYAIIEIQSKDGKTINIDSRPSDAIATAVRTPPLYFVSENVMMQAKLVNAEKDAEEDQKVQRFLDNVKPEDFTKHFKKD